MRNGKLIFRIFPFLFLFASTITVFGKEYFLYDLEKNKILFMGANDLAFTEKIEMPKNPDLMMQTADPQKYLAIFLPKEEKVDKKRSGKVTPKNQAGQLIIYNMASGRTEDLVELGYAPFKWAYTPDHQHFYISYQPSPGANSFDLLHYNVSELKVEKVSGFASEVRQLLCADQKLFALVGKKEKTPPQLLIFKSEPLGLDTALAVDNNSENFYFLGADRLVLLDLDRNPSRKNQEGALKLISTRDNLVTEEFKCKPFRFYTKWYEKEKVLIVDLEENSPQKSRTLKITADGFRYYEIPNNWISLDYFAEKDALYVLTEDNLKVIDYQNSSTRYFLPEGSNQLDDLKKENNYQFYFIPNSHLAVLYCLENGNVKFFDSEKNQFLKNIGSGRAGVKIFNTITFRFGQNTETVVSTNPNQTKFFIMNRATKDITVFDGNFKRLNYLIPLEPLIGMCQIKKPILKTLVVSNKRIYKINEEKLTLEPVHQFKNPTEHVHFFEEDQRMIILADQEMVVLDPKTLAVKNKFYLFGNPDEKYTKLKPGAQRYFFIPVL